MPEDEASPTPPAEDPAQPPPVETPAGPPADAKPYRKRWFHAQDGMRLFYREFGDPLLPGLPLLCLPGLTRNARDFAGLARREMHRRRVICPDYRGRGRSSQDPDWQNYCPPVLLRDIGHLLAAANLGRVVVCGTSLGGLLAMGLAVTMPASLAGVILNDIGPKLEPDGLARIRDYVGRPAEVASWNEAVAFAKKVYGEEGRRSERDWLAVARGTFHEQEDGRLVLDYDPAIAKSLGGPMPDLMALYRALRPVPVLALRGAASSVLSQETFDRMADEKPDLERVTVPEVGHTPTLMEPPAVEAIDDFLTRLDAGSDP